MTLQDQLRKIQYTPTSDNAEISAFDLKQAREKISHLLLKTMGEVTFLRYTENDMIQLSRVTDFAYLKGTIYLWIVQHDGTIEALDFTDVIADFGKALAFLFGFTDTLTWEE